MLKYVAFGENKKKNQTVTSKDQEIWWQAA